MTADLEEVRGRALDLLARREHSRKELCTKLSARGYTEESAIAVINALAAENLQSDERFADAYARSRNTKGFGPVRILNELRERGVDDALAKASVDAQASFWGERARDVLEKRFGCSRPEDFRARAKQMRFLEYRGFTFDQISSVLPNE